MGVQGEEPVAPVARKADVRLPYTSGNDAANLKTSSREDYCWSDRRPGSASPDGTNMAYSITTYNESHFDGVDALWREAFPNDSAWNAARISIPEKLKVQPDLLLVAVEGDHVVGSVMAGYDGHRGWISRIAVLRSHRLTGIGQALIQEAERRLAALGCIKINLQVVGLNAAVLGFYQKAGYDIEERVSMSKRIFEV
jgi:ribosomal protein S18 acetylase RimI-like enzyme